MKRIVVLGAQGFIGSEVTREMRHRGHHIHDLPFGSTGLDIADAAACRSTFRELQPDVVINLAGRGATRNSATLDEIYAINAHGAANVARAIAAMGEKRPYLVQVGSSLEPLPGAKPESAYAASKAIGSALVHDALQDGGLAHLRIGNVYGPGMPTARLVMALTTALHERKSIVLQWPERARDFCFIDDVVAHIAAVAESQAPGVTDYAVGTKQATTLLELAEHIADLTGSERRLIRTAQPQFDEHRAAPQVPAEAQWLVCETSLRAGLELTLRRMT